MSETRHKYLEKSEESLASAKDNLAQKRFNSCANRTYYACYQAAVALLLKYNITPISGKEIRKHGFVQAQVSTLIRRKKVLPSKHRSTLPDLMVARTTADYDSESVSKPRAEKLLKKAKEFVNLVIKEAN